MDKFNINKKILTDFTAIGRIFKEKEEKIPADINAISIVVILYILNQI